MTDDLAERMYAIAESDVAGAMDIAVSEIDELDLGRRLAFDAAVATRLAIDRAHAAVRDGQLDAVPGLVKAVADFRSLLAPEPDAPGGVDLSALTGAELDCLKAARRVLDGERNVPQAIAQEVLDCLNRERANHRLTLDTLARERAQFHEQQKLLIERHQTIVALQEDLAKRRAAYAELEREADLRDELLKVFRKYVPRAALDAELPANVLRLRS